MALGLVEGSNVELIDVEALGEGERHDDLLLPAIQRVMDRAGRQSDELQRIVCSIGPGGYTGLRIATAAANMIALTTRARLFGVPSAWVSAASAQSKSPFGVALASKGASCFLTQFDPDARPLDEGRLAGPDDIEGLGLGLLVADRFLSPAVREEAERLGLRVIPPVFKAKACLALAPRALEVPVGGLVPMYGREAEAVTKWRQLHPDSGV